MSLVRVNFITGFGIVTKMKTVCIEIANLLMGILHYTTPNPIKEFEINNSEVYVQRSTKRAGNHGT
jgi:hypothetical protein